VTDAKPVTIAIDENIRVSGLLQAPKSARACYVLAHGAGAGMHHAFMAAVAAELADRGIATLRYQFPYMEKGSKRPDPPKLAHATVRAAVAEAARLLPKLPLIAGGKSFGGRMTSQAQAAAACPAFAVWRSSDFRCIQPDVRRRNVVTTCSTSRSRCCSCKARATSSRCSTRSSRSAKRSALAPPW
jgi:predicted alpha/beta hydrolase